MALLRWSRSSDLEEARESAVRVCMRMGKLGGWGRAKRAEFNSSRKGLSVLEDENGLFLETRGVGERVTGWSRPGHCRGFGFDFSSDGMPLEGAASISRKTPWAFCGEVTP